MSAPARRLLELDVLRGIAAIAVVGFHYTSRFDAVYGHSEALAFFIPLGHYGVELFFVISGFVIMMTLDRTKTAAEFAISRISRLYPAYWVAALFTAAVVTVAELPGRGVSIPQVLVNLTMLQEYLGVKHVDGVYWTLTVELTFYAIMLVLFRLRALARIELVCVAWLAVAGVLMGLRLAFDLRVPVLELLVIARFAHLFIAGIMFYRARRFGYTPVRVALILAAIAAQLASSVESAIVVAVIVAVFAALVAGRLHWLASKPLLFLGSLTYTLYLVHQNLGFAIIRWGYGAGLDPHLSIAIALAAAVTVATLLSIGVERPMQPVMKHALGRLFRIEPAPTLATAHPAHEATHAGNAAETDAERRERAGVDTRA
jgi:peptidoglycan/LPS O-acetylase OafA/YrhL